MMNKAFFLIAVNAESLPAQIPPFLMRLVLLLSDTRKAVLETESLVSVVMQSGDAPRERTARIASLLMQFVEEHGNKIREASREFAVTRLAVHPDFVTAIGSELALLALVVSNMKMRGEILSEIGKHQSEWAPAESMTLQCLGESCKGQGYMLDWMNREIINRAPNASEPRS